MISLNQVLGVLNVQYRQIHDHSGDDIEFLTTVGELVGTYLRMTASRRAPIPGSALVAAVLGAPAADGRIATAREAAQ